jgi:hypothetical protein
LELTTQIILEHVNTIDNNEGGGVVDDEWWLKMNVRRGMMWMFWRCERWRTKLLKNEHNTSNLTFDRIYA